MLIVAVMNGWSASSRRKETRTATLVREFLYGGGIEFKFLARKSMLFMSRCRKFRRYIMKHNSSENELLIVGKSLGAHNLVVGVLNELPKLRYRRTAMLTIDPCWPLLNDWKPNLNSFTLLLRKDLGLAINVYVESDDPDAQVGSRLGPASPAIMNWPADGYDHYSIVNSEQVFEALVMTSRYVLEGRET